MTVMNTKEKGATIDSITSKLQSRLYHSKLFSYQKEKVSVSHYFNKIIKFLQKFCERDGTIENEVAKKLFPHQNYYNEEYFMYLHHFNYDYFNKVIDKFSYKNKAKSKEIEQFNRILTEIKRTNDKFSLLKPRLNSIDLKSNKVILDSFQFINYIFALGENSLTEELNKEIISKIAKTKEERSILNAGTFKKLKSKKI